jgi:hypothetical protein
MGQKNKEGLFGLMTNVKEMFYSILVSNLKRFQAYRMFISDFNGDIFKLAYSQADKIG